MSEQQQRRDFFAKCLGGIGLGVLGVGTNEAAAARPRIPGKPMPSDSAELKSPGKLEGKEHFQLRTDGTPRNTQLLRNDKPIFGVEQLLVEFNATDPKRHWVGVSLFALDGQTRDSDKHIYPRIRHENELPVVCDHRGVRIPFPVLECYHHVQFGARKVFLACEMPVELIDGFSLETHLREDERVYRMHMTPESTHMTVVSGRDALPSQPNLGLEKGLDLTDKSSWLVGYGRDQVLLQLYPSIHPAVSQWRSQLQG